MAETGESIIDHYRRMRADLMAAIEGMDEARLCETTIVGWSVKDNLAHLAYWDDLRADEITRISAGHQSALRTNDEQERALNEVCHGLRRDLTLEQVIWELEHSHRRVLDALAAASPAAFDPSRYGEAGLRGTHETAHTRYIRDWRARMGY